MRKSKLTSREGVRDDKKKKKERKTRDFSSDIKE